MRIGHRGSSRDDLEGRSRLRDRVVSFTPIPKTGAERKDLADPACRSRDGRRCSRCRLLASLLSCSVGVVRSRRYRAPRQHPRQQGPTEPAGSQSDRRDCYDDRCHPPGSEEGERDSRKLDAGQRQAHPYRCPRLRERIQYSVAAKQMIRLSAYGSGAGYGPGDAGLVDHRSKRTAPPVAVASSNPQMRSAIPIAPRTPPAIISAPARRRARSAPSKQ